MNEGRFLFEKLYIKVNYALVKIKELSMRKLR